MDACTLDRCVDGSVDDDGAIDDSDHTAIKFEVSPDSYPIEIDSDLDKVSTFTG